MTAQQAAETKYPYFIPTEVWEVGASYQINKQIDHDREIYAQALTDQPQLSRSVLEEAVRRGFVACSKHYQITSVNLDDLIPTTPSITEEELVDIINSMQRRKFDTKAEDDAYLLAYKDLILEISRRGKAQLVKEMGL